LTKQNPKKFGKPKSLSQYSNTDPLQKTSLLSKVFGNQRKLDDARESFFSSYEFESNVSPMRLISFFLLLSIVLCIAMFFIERSNENIYKSWTYQGVTTIPPSDALDFDLVIEFSRKENFDKCDSNNPKKLLEGICDKPLEFVNDMNKTQSRSQVLYIFQFLLMFLLFFPLGTFFHRSLRNIKTLKYQTSLSPEKMIVWIYFAIFLYFLAIFISRFVSKEFNVAFVLFLIPLFFLSFRILKTFLEIYKGSLIDVPNNLLSIFTIKFKLWIATFIAVLFFNPSTITRFWAYNSTNVGDLIDGTKLMYFSAILLIIFCLLTIVMVVEIYKLQEIKKIKIGSITVDPLQ
tara:strand:+ start:6496 stop:7533 length:1038 start_codon:yes stop_codon:yes gene_type:complete